MPYTINICHSSGLHKGPWPTKAGFAKQEKERFQVSKAEKIIHSIYSYYFLTISIFVSFYKIVSCNVQDIGTSAKIRETGFTEPNYEMWM